jgi:hypothetical protein
MTNIVGMIKESSTLKEDVMPRLSIFPKRKNLIFTMPLDLELYLKM